MVHYDPYAVVEESVQKYQDPEVAAVAMQAEVQASADIPAIHSAEAGAGTGAEVDAAVNAVVADGDLGAVLIVDIDDVAAADAVADIVADSHAAVASVAEVAATVDVQNEEATTDSMASNHSVMASVRTA